jgi:RNA polymerase sigma factor (TIGR02999 family)
VDHARKHQYAKRGGGVRPVTLDERIIASEEKPTDIVALDEALTRLAAIAPRKSEVVELRYFGGLTIEEIAEVLKVSPGTVRRDWTTAKAWLYRAIRDKVSDAP